MLAYYELPYDNTDQIAEQVLNYLKDNTGLLDNRPSVPWNFLDRDSVLKSCPALLEYFKNHKLMPRDISVTVCYDNLSLHYDSPPVIGKVNFPILNTANSVNRWYTISESDYDNLKWVEDPFGRKHEDILSLPKDRLTLFAEYRGMVNPIVLHSRIPHEVVLLDNAVVPRIVLSCTFYNDPKHYLGL